MRIARPGPGNGWRATISSGRPNSRPDCAHLVFEQQPQRLDKGELQIVGQTADIVVALDVRCAGPAAGLHHVGIQRALHQELSVVVPQRIPHCAFETRE